jgi:protein-tyrosine phosphatase
MAAGYLLKLLEQRGIKHVEIRTAGVMTPTGLLPTPEAVLLLNEEGVDIRRHRSRPLNAEMITKADLVLGMTPFHVQTAFRMTDLARGRTFLLKEYVGREGRNTQIADPMGGTLEIFKKCFGEIRASLQRLVDMELVVNPPEGWVEPPPPEPEVLDEPEVTVGAKSSASSDTPKKRRGRPPKAEKAEVKKRAKTPRKAKPAAAKAKIAKPKKAAKPAKVAKVAKPAKPVAKAKKAAPAKAAKVKAAKTAKKKAKPAARKKGK